MDVYFIRDWDEHFESAESRKLKNLYWVLFPNKHDGRRYRRLLRQPNGPAMFGAFVVVVEAASRCPMRGVLANKFGPLTVEDIADGTGFPLKLLQETLDYFADQKDGWIVKAEWKTGFVPEKTQRDPDLFPTSPDSSGKGQEKPVTKSRVEKSRKEKKKGAAKSAAPTETFFARLKADPKYKGIDIDNEFSKAERWIAANPDRQLTERFFLRWLVNAERVMETTTEEGSSTPPVLRDVSERLLQNFSGDEPTLEMARRMMKEYTAAQLADFVKLALERKPGWGAAMQKCLDFVKGEPGAEGVAA